MLKGKFYLAHLAGHYNGLAVITETYFEKVKENFPGSYRDFVYKPFFSEKTFTELNSNLPVHIQTMNPVEFQGLSDSEKNIFEFHKLIINFYKQKQLAAEPWWNFLTYYSREGLALAEALVEFHLRSEWRVLSELKQGLLVKYRPALVPLLQAYFANDPPPNNKDAQSLRLNCYDGNQGDLFLWLDQYLKVSAVASIIVTEEIGGPVAKIYGRLHLKKGVPHSTIDRFFEPALFDWCESKKIARIYLTINEGNLRTLEWTARRIGERRHLFRKNPYSPTIGHHFRKSLIPYEKMIFERGVWQYVIFSSPDGKFCIDRPTKPIDHRAKEILRKEYEKHTQDWH